MSTSHDKRTRLDAAMARLPLVAILRGLQPHEAAGIGATLQQAGFVLIEVPLNSPQPFDSIATLRRTLAPDTLVGAGTVTHIDDVERLHALGADLVVMPHANAALIRAAKAHGMLCIPGVATPTEAFVALEAGADALKLFPAELVTSSVMKAMRAVLPRDTALLPVGGITPASLSSWHQAGATGFGLGSALYAPGDTADVVGRRAANFVQGWRACACAGLPP